MREVYFESDNIISSLGFTTTENIERLKSGNGGIELLNDKSIYDESFPISLINKEIFKSLITENQLQKGYTTAEQLCILSCLDALKNSTVDVKSNRTIFVFSTTKGNIDLLEKAKSELFPKERLQLWAMSKVVTDYFGNTNSPVTISNACISGVVAINTASELIKADRYDNAVVIGIDVVSKFVVSGFHSFKSVANEPCKPFDADRVGLTLGEAAGTLILTADQTKVTSPKIKYCGGSSANDANHISGPSRTAEGSVIAINKTLQQANSLPSDVDHISAHGTATPYNDEMESIAITRCEMINAPVNSLKGFWGHTLGAAGVIETIALAHSMKQNIMFPTLGYNNHGVTQDIEIVKDLTQKDIRKALKMASGFGGCNAALLIEKTI